MRLTELEPKFIRYEGRNIKHHLPSTTGAQGVMFLCPACFVKNKGAVGTHLIEVSFADRGVTDDQGSVNREGKPSRWSVSGTSYDNLTLTPSILIDPAGECCPGWHGFVTSGEVA